MIRSLLKLLLVMMLAIVGLIGAVMVLLIIMNGRDPYGGPIEPSAPH